MSNDISSQLQARVRAAQADRTPLAIRAGGSKAFYGRKVVGEPLDVSGHAGIVSHAPKRRWPHKARCCPSNHPISVPLPRRRGRG